MPKANQYYWFIAVSGIVVLQLLTKWIPVELQSYIKPEDNEFYILKKNPNFHRVNHYGYICRLFRRIILEKVVYGIRKSLWQYFNKIKILETLRNLNLNIIIEQLHQILWKLNSHRRRKDCVLAQFSWRTGREQEVRSIE